MAEAAVEDRPQLFYCHMCNVQFEHAATVSIAFISDYFLNNAYKICFRCISRFLIIESSFNIALRELFIVEDANKRNGIVNLDSNDNLM